MLRIVGIDCKHIFCWKTFYEQNEPKAFQLLNPKFSQFVRMLLLLAIQRR